MVEAVLRPVPVGAFPLPFGYLLMPTESASDSGEVRDELLAGRLPTQWAPHLRGHELAAAGDTVGALAAMTGDDVVTRYNRFVLDPDSADVDAIRRGLGPLGPLVDVVLFALDRRDEPPAADGLDGEVLALVLAAHAAVDLHAGRLDDAIALLTRAIDAAESSYPPLAGVLYGAAGQACRQAGDLPAAIAALTAGTKLLAGTDLDIGCAELFLELATLFHEMASADRPDLLNPAVNHYHSALQLIDATTAPELYAAAHANLATAYLTMPMVEASDQLRLGVAVGSLRAALDIYTIETHPVEWGSAQLNLANALVYAPSTHQADNLTEAVELYEAVLVQRDRQNDPVGYARVLSNQGNALAHLGMFEHARGKLVEARYLFEESGELDATHSVRGLLDEIARATSLATAGGAGS